MIAAAWDALSPEERRQAHGVVLCVALFLLHFALWSPWYVEDAAITFAFARNGAIGEGLVAWPGGEPVEGFSNPSWTLLLLFLRLLGLSPWIAAKLLGAALGAGTLVLAFSWARRLVPGRWAVAVPLLLAVSPQYTMWCASGLENPLFGFFLALGVELLLQEVRAPRPPYSALAFFGLAVTRPEAPLYVAVAGGLGGLFLLRERGARGAWRWAWRWGLWLGLPFVAFHALRIGYFAWELPNTYYAKLGEDGRFRPLGWTSRGWRYLREYGLASGLGFLLPLFVLGQTGVRGWRGVAGVLSSVALVAVLVPGLDWPEGLLWPSFSEPEWSIAVRVATLATLGMLLPGIGLDRPADAPRVLAWGLLCTVLFFALYSGGDWMEGYRWISLGAVPLLVLLVDGVHEVAGRSRVASGLLLAVPLVLGVVRTTLLMLSPETSPYDVYKRVVAVDEVLDRVGLRDATLMEVDMGAHLWWSDLALVDMAGLVDVPMGHHEWETAFVEQYVYEELRPELAHVHGGWARRTRMTGHGGWREYVELPPVPISRRVQHVGTHLHRSVLTGSVPDREAGFGPVTLAGFSVASPAAGSLYLEVGFRRGRRGGPFRAWAFLSGPELHVWELPPAYDWLEVRRWTTRETVVGRHALPLPDLPPGRYDLGFVIATEDGVLPVEAAPEDAVTGDPRLARGEVRWPGAVEVVTAAEAARLAAAGHDAALALAEDGACAEAQARATEAVRLGAAPIEGPLARCYARWAEATGEVAAIAEARSWDHRDPLVVSVGEEIADRLVAEGNRLAAAGDDAGAYAAWRDALKADPRRTWVRRRAEAARDRTLDLD